MASFKLDTATGDLDLTNGKATLLYDDDSLRQRLDCRLRLVTGEWFRDQNSGTDYFGEILGKTTELQRRAEFRRRILSTEGVDSILELSLEHDGVTRTMSGEIIVITDDGYPLDIQFGATVGA
jgi:hypothetical protein